MSSRDPSTVLQTPRVLVLARNYPNNAFPTLGLWTERFVAASAGIARPTVVAPVPYAPPLIPMHWARRFRSVERDRTNGSVTVHHPRVPAGPGQLLHALDARLAFRTIRRTVLALHAAEPFDVLGVDLRIDQPEPPPFELAHEGDESDLRGVRGGGELKDP